MICVHVTLPKLHIFYILCLNLVLDDKGYIKGCLSLQCSKRDNRFIPQNCLTSLSKICQIQGTCTLNSKISMIFIHLYRFLVNSARLLGNRLCYYNVKKGIHVICMLFRICIALIFLNDLKFMYSIV